jgi:hypothetical protein
MDWIGLAEDSNRWKALENTVMNLQVPWEILELLSYWQLLKKG